MDYLEELLAGLKLSPTMRLTQLLLKQWQQEAEDLEQRWLHAKSQCNFFARKLRAHALQQQRSMAMASRAKARSQTSLINLPEELLCEIFDYTTYLRHPSIRSLLLVCKRFHRIIIGTSSLWTRIDLNFPEDLMGSRFPTKVYIRACLKRSERRLLDITIKLPHRINPTEYAIQRIEKELAPKIGQHGAESVAQILYDIDWETDDELVIKKGSRIERLINLLVGVDLEHMRRWKSLILTLPEEILGANHIMGLLGGVTPHLHSLEIKNFRDADLLDIWPFPEVPRLHTMTIDGHPQRLFGDLPRSLTSLDIIYGNGNIVHALRDLEQLRHLCVRDADNKARSAIPITLPHLSTLHIHGICDQILAVIIAPRLEKLLVRSSQISVVQSFPSVPSIEWYFHGSEAKNLLVQISLLSLILQKITGTSCLTLQGISTGTVSKIANDLKKGGKVSASLKVIEIIKDDVRTLVCNWT